MARSAKLNEPTKEQLATKKKYRGKEPHSIMISHEAWELFQRIAEARRLGIGDLFEVTAQEEAVKWLSEDVRLQAKRHHEAEVAKRQTDIDKLEQELAASA